MFHFIWQTVYKGNDAWKSTMAAMLVNESGRYEQFL
jgi:hypothetical protein